MGIEIELHSERPVRSDWARSRGTILRGRYEHGDALASALALLGDGAPGWLAQIAPYGDTILNEQEAAAARQEIPGLLSLCTGDDLIAAVQDLRALLSECAATPGSYLWLIGD